MNNRVVGIDFIKLCVAIVVVSIHTYLFMDISDNGYFMWKFVVSSVAVPFFFIVSGYFLGRKVKDEVNIERVIVGVQKSRTHLFKCYCIWALWYSIVYFIRDIIFGMKLVPSFAKHLISFAIGSPNTAIWYVATAVIGLFLFQKILLCTKRKIVFLIMLGGAIVLYVFSYYWHHLPDELTLLVEAKKVYDSFLSNDRLFVFRLNWLFIGIFFGWLTNIDLSREKIITIRELVGICCCGMAVVLVDIYGYFEDQICICLLSMIWYVVLSLWLIKLGYRLSANIRSTEQNGCIGEIATGIYFVHPTFVLVCDITMLKFDVNLSRTVEFFICLLLSYIVVICIKHNKRIYNKLF